MGMGGGDGQISAHLMGKFYLITFICLLRNSFASCSMGEGVTWILVRVINAHFNFSHFLVSFLVSGHNS